MKISITMPDDHIPVLKALETGYGIRPIRYQRDLPGLAADSGISHYEIGDAELARRFMADVSNALPDSKVEVVE